MKITARKKGCWGWSINRQCQLIVIILLGLVGFLSVQVVHHQQQQAMHDAAEESERLHERINKVHHPHPDKFHIKHVVVPKPRSPQRVGDALKDAANGSSKARGQQVGHRLGERKKIPEKNKDGMFFFRHNVCGAFLFGHNWGARPCCTRCAARGVYTGGGSASRAGQSISFPSLSLSPPS